MFGFDGTSNANELFTLSYHLPNGGYSELMYFYKTTDARLPYRL